MKFNEAVNYISENMLDVEMAKPKNPEIEKLVAQGKGMPYWKARQMANKAGAGAAPAPKASAPTGATKIDPRDQEKVDALVAQGVAPEEIYKSLKNTLPGERPFVGNMQDVQAMINAAQGEEAPADLEEPQIDPAELRKAAIRDRLAKFGMKVTPVDKSKAADKLKASIGKIKSRGRKSSGEELAGFKEPEPEEIVGGTGSQNPYDYEGQD